MNALRKLARGVAKKRMKKAGMQHICKHTVIKNGGDKSKSKFAEHWKEYVHYEPV